MRILGCATRELHVKLSTRGRYAVMAMVDLYPGMPTVPSFGSLRNSLFNVLLASAVAVVLILVLSRYLLHLSMFNRLVASNASGSASDTIVAEQQKSRLGETGTTISPLRPGGKARRALPRVVLRRPDGRRCDKQERR